MEISEEQAIKNAMTREYIYPTGMQTHHNEEVYYDHASGKPFKELYPSLYSKGYAFIGIYVVDHGVFFINDDEAEEYIKKKLRISMQGSYDRGYHYYSEWVRESWQ